MIAHNKQKPVLIQNNGFKMGEEPEMLTQIIGGKIRDNPSSEMKTLSFMPVFVESFSVRPKDYYY